LLSFFRKYHKWFSLVATFFILLFAVSGIILNHRKELSGVDIDRKWLPDNYRYQKWNLAAVKGAVTIGRDSVLVYGNIGTWLTDSAFTRFKEFNTGLPAGIDNRKINTVSWSAGTGLFAGTLYGLYRWDRGGWQYCLLPEHEPRVVRVLPLGDSVWVMTRSSLFLTTVASHYTEFRRIPLPAGELDDGKTGLFRTLWVIHSGEIYGLPGKLIVDGVGLIFILLCITGLIYFFIPGMLKKAGRLKDHAKRAPRQHRLKGWSKGSLRWHNVVGSWAIVILLLNTTTGMFLRPPLLIPVAEKRVNKIPWTELSDPNPWADRLRDLQWDAGLKRFLVASSDGIFYSDDHFKTALKLFPVQPPVSVMGITVFTVDAPGRYSVGSFSGLFEWEPAAGTVLDAVTRTPYTDTGRSGPPFGAVSVSGMIRAGDGSVMVFDYAKGVFALTGKNFLSDMPLWNTCLEIHTGRIFEPLTGMLYILVVPLTGLATLFILISGFFAWWLPKRRKAALK
jgi:hypothetical protein